jgi:hypothetical protein
MGSSFYQALQLQQHRWGFSLAVSGMMIPPAVFSSAAAGFTITLSCKGTMLNFLDINE